MTIHAFIEYLKYRSKAKGRHGTHSPFVYSFIEDIVQDRKKISINNQIEFPGLPLQYTKLLNRIIQYYNYKNIRWLPAEQSDNVKDCDVIILPPKEPMLWASLANKHFSTPKNDTAVFVLNIHKTVLYSNEWNRICNHPEVLMSIDLYDIGLLFFKKDFKEKQHFILKYKI